MPTRRHFLTTTALASAALGQNTKPTPKEPLFKISLAQWSNHRTIKAGKMKVLDWPAYAANTHQIHALEYVTHFFKDKAQDKTFLTELKKRTTDLNSKNVLLMVDGEGQIAANSETARQKTVDNHKKWVEAAKFLGCHSIRINCYGEGPDDKTIASNAIKGLTSLSNFAKDHNINIIVENHGGLSSNGKWMADVLKQVKLPNCGSLPDFGNFFDYDRYQGIKDLMPYAKGVSAKSNNFDKNGEETETDFLKALKIVLKHGYRGYVGIELGKSKHPEDEGIKLTKTLLENCRTKLTSIFSTETK